MDAYCDYCKQRYDPYLTSQKFCCEICREKAHNTALNQKWATKEKTPKKPRSQANSLKFRNSYAYYNEPGWMKKFRSVRG